ncbi:hypothetical protein APSETT444_000760 [Aspergillus pseudonomiae]
MSGLFQNIYHLRRVADTAAKACYVCHKPSSSVMITPDNKDRHFCSPIVDTEDEEKKKKEEALAKEIEKVKKEYEEKQKKKKDKTKEKKSDEESKKEEGSSTDKKEGNDEKERDDKMRIDRLRNLEAAKRNRQRLQDPSFFPSVPSGGL